MELVIENTKDRLRNFARGIEPVTTSSEGEGDEPSTEPAEASPTAETPQ